MQPTRAVVPRNPMKVFWLQVNSYFRTKRGAASQKSTFCDTDLKRNGELKVGISGTNLYDFALLRQGRPGKHPIRHCFEEKWKVENGGIVLVIRILQDEPIRETRENLIPFRRMIKGRKSYIMATTMMINHYHDHHHDHSDHDDENESDLNVFGIKRKLSMVHINMKNMIF